MSEWSVSSNVAKASDGVEVFSVDRETMGYRDGKRVVHFAVERGAKLAIYDNSLALVSGEPIPAGQSKAIFDRCVSGVRALGYGDQIEIV